MNMHATYVDFVAFFISSITSLIHIYYVHGIEFLLFLDWETTLYLVLILLHSTIMHYL